ncbi:30S ribosomal protein S21, chloroplastic [Carica papaya]|uniref:30S ribosomal protein S21, chloroplastic n=1 Tax=Carica papaya TaxID=3649 RepID=UPI000B8CFD61|nr:30S ribosomal protein S21, chloroplastic [Carica papaya]
MATSFSLPNFISFLFPSNPPPPPPKLPPSDVHLPSSSHAQKLRNGSVSMAGQEAHSSYSSSSSSLSAELSSVVCPSVAYANTLFFRSAYNVQVIVDDNEPEERLLNRFRREVMKAGVIQECKRRRFFENKQDEKKRKSREAAKRNRRRRGQFRSFQNKQETPVVKKDEDEDNWEMPEGDLPY